MSFKVAISLAPILSTAVLAAAANADTGATDLMPLDDTSLAVAYPDNTLSTVETSINDALIASRGSNEGMLNFAELPLVREFVDDNGYFGLKMDTAISMQVVNSMDGSGYGVGVRRQF